MIDDYDEAMALLQELEAQLPLPARPASALARSMKDKGIHMAHYEQLAIKRVFYMGDEGGLMCDVTLEGAEAKKEAVVCSLTHLRVDSRHPLTGEIQLYQEKRTRKLAQQGGPRAPSSFTVEPRKRRGH
ncbi:MAG TPA: hypothetical protein VFL17_11880 [Anaerolineae bacterium]|nr:hypothetical protein [Anaerolineae bacterium]